MKYNTLNEALHDRAQNNVHVNFINGLNDQSSLSFAALYQRALQCLHYFQKQGLTAGNQLIFFLNNNQRFIEAYWACLLGGIVPVPVAVGISDEHRSKLFRIFQRLQNCAVLIDQKGADLLSSYAKENELDAEHEQIAGKTIIAEDIVFAKQGEEHATQPDDIAFIQFSSGSTRDPKGVVLTHRNLVTTVLDLGNRAQYSEKDIALSWMPLTHDLGLIGFHINMLVFNMNHYIMATELFSRRPLAWLQKVHETRATVLSSPNFGYKHYLKLYHSRSDHNLDLSCIRTIMNAAEPISIALCYEFNEVMVKHGLSKTAIYPCYGLAEAALAVSLPVPGSEFKYVSVDRNSLAIGHKADLVAQDHPNAVRFAIEGPPVENCEVRIADLDDRALPEAYIGEVQLYGPNVTSGYYNDDEANQNLFTQDRWLRTGDLGLYYQGQLVITGRLKDIIFANGLNYYPHDLEAVALGCAELELGKVVALGVRVGESDHDDILICVLYRGDLNAFVPIVRSVKQLINERVGLEVTHVLPVKRIPKTTSGKVQRRFFADAYTTGEYQPISAEIERLLQEQTGPAEQEGLDAPYVPELLEIFQRALPETSMAAQADFFEVGLSSLDLAAFQEHLDQQYPGVVDITDMFDHPTLVDLATLIEQRRQ